ncbi:MAG: hypothetical protein A2945_02710 [Candidatus Liptonbacteria bacterium RIFCSPLOWO2_01_FULL_52_25]|uniref:Methyltransferase n=1 Tax=Candidatus Liptonbacteria bacterium RIFCSPLOWO2_01_FULL_52_25 TaxID=1798650 RepID=A0A1G2CGV3_9BACT|nr:MAG: hypothetical protein A2945_02710 [Candidatus Liptonbacteria bacterium RIFCSPLOWO2_01_FULL_52_25]
MDLQPLKTATRKRFPFLVPLIGPIFIALRDWRLKFITWQRRYDEYGLMAEASCAFISDERYTKSRDAAIKECKQLPPTGGDWRLYVGCWAAEHALKLEGDFVECGVDRGLLSRTIAGYLDFSRVNKKFYLIDSFGVMKGYTDTHEEVKSVFSNFKNISVIKGSVPQILKTLPETKFAYVCIDMNSPEPEIAAANFFWDKMPSGAIMLFDDYGIPGREPQHDAFDAWAKTKNVSVLSLPTTQGLVIKP